ncbi:hypothetical protein TrRE_jg8225 [Triparma retinervis]|uniref:EGF-like domain-containing protein n=1 Tax=Triparma retinervis TaxID=2557542 RepID=A0A9W7DTE0_9STRA|nr:hypothetical protein TrRE_jg8225 [Triparma retinervis]
MASLTDACIVEAYSYRFYPCSNNGVCSNSTCICAPGWTGRSDFLNHEGIDCQVHETTIIVINIALFLVSTLNLVVLLSSLVPDLLRAFFPNVAPLGTSGKVAPTRHESTKVSGTSSTEDDPSSPPPRKASRRLSISVSSNKLPVGYKRIGIKCFKEKFIAAKFFGSVQSIGWMAMSIQHLTTDNVVGTDIGITVFNAIGAINFWAFTFQSLYTVVSLAAKSSGQNSDEINRTVKNYKFGVTVAFCLVLIANSLTLVMAVDNSTQSILTPAYYVMTMFAIIAAQIFTHKYCGLMVQVLTEHDKGQGKLTGQITKFKLLVNVVVKRGVGNAILNLCFAVWPFLYNKVAYQLPGQWVIACLMCLAINHKVIPKQILKLKVESA